VEGHARADGRGGRGRWLGWSILIGYWAFAAAGFALGPLQDSRAFSVSGELTYRIAYGAYATVGALIVLRQPGNRVGWVLCAIGLASGPASFAQAYSWYALTQQPASLSGGLAAGWLGSWLFYPAFQLLIFLLLLFPDGRLPSHRWRPVVWIAAADITLSSVWAAFAPRPFEGPPWPENPWGIQQAAAAFDVLGTTTTLTLAALLVLSAFSLIGRYRRSQGQARQQLKWFTYGIVLLVLAWLVPKVLFWQGPHDSGQYQPSRDILVEVLLMAAAVMPAVAIGIAILKHRLYDIDRLISRSLVYAGLTAAVVVVYVATVGLLGAAFQRQGLGVSLLATGVVAVGFQPLRERLQRGVDRLLYGQRDDPYAVLARLGQRLEATLAPEAVLPSIVETLAQALKLPYAAVELRHGDQFEVVASTGRPVGAPMRLPLTYQGELLGYLLCAPRPLDTEFSPADQRLLADVARHAGVAGHAVRLTAQLQRSRQRLVTAREEERRRLRRDLHDGLGPALAGVMLQLSTTKALLDQNPQAARELLDRLRGEVQEAIVDIRRLVYQLRPPALDELGLVGALREQATHFSLSPQYQVPGRPARSLVLTVGVDAPAVMPPLPAAVEVAAYRIATEALTNAARHAQARGCTVRLTLDGALQLEVSDDGRGLPVGYRAGVGLASMRERAAELGGTCTVEPASGGGTRVHAHLPMPVPEET
jgi:two-component system NarL family sensor kinase